MSHNRYFSPTGGLPGQSELLTGRAVLTDAYAIIPRGTMTDIVTSLLPSWERTRVWIIARPLSGFAETFSQYIVQIQPQGGSTAPEPDPTAEAGLFVTAGEVSLTLNGQARGLGLGDFAFLPAGCDWQLRNQGSETAVFHWIRKRFQPAPGLAAPDPVFASDRELNPVALPHTDGRWATTRFIDPADVRYDMHVDIVTFRPGAVIPFAETHVMEHGLYILQGKGVYRLNQDWVEVEAGDFLWLRAFCPQACYAGGPEPFRYLLYKDVNRHVPLAPLDR